MVSYYTGFEGPRKAYFDQILSDVDVLLCWGLWLFLMIWVWPFIPGYCLIKLLPPFLYYGRIREWWCMTNDHFFNSFCLFSCPTTCAFDIWPRCCWRGRLCPAVLHRYEGWRAAVHILDISRRPVRVWPWHPDLSHRQQGQHAGHCQRGEGSQWQLHLQCQEWGWLCVANCRPQSEW